MRLTAFALSVLGGVIGLIGPWPFTLLWPPLVVTADRVQTGPFSALGGVGLICCLIGFVGAGVVLENPRLAASLLLPAGLVLLYATGGFALISALLLVAAAILAACSAGSRPARRCVAVVDEGR